MAPPLICSVRALCQRWYVLESEMKRILSSKTDDLHKLSYAAAKAIPSRSSEEIVIGEKRVQITVFNQEFGPERQQRLIVVQVAEKIVLGLGSRYWEQGLIYTPDKPVREASETELQENGG
jgi:hypothetical protein